MKTFKIYHTEKVLFEDEIMNDDVKRKFVGEIQAKDLDDAWIKTQNPNGQYDTGWNKVRTRSSCIGDIFEVDEIKYIVVGFGFIEL